MAAYARNPIPEIPVSQFQVKGGVHFADGGIYNTLVKALPRGRRSRTCSTRRTVIRGGVGPLQLSLLLRRRQPDRLLAAHRRHHHHEQRHHLPDRPHQPAARRQPDPARRLLAGPGHRLGLPLGTVVPLGAEVALLRALAGRDPARPRPRLGGGADVPGLARLATCPSCARSTASRRSSCPPRARATPPTRRSSASRSRTRSRACCPGRPSTAPPSRARSSCGRSRSSARIITEEYVGSDSYHAGTIRVEKRFAERQLAADHLHPLAPARQAELPEPGRRRCWRTASRPTTGRTASRWARPSACPSATGRRWGSDWKGFAEAAARRLELSGTYQYQTGFPLTWGVGTSVYYDLYYDPRIRRTSSPTSARSVRCGIAGLDCPAWDTVRLLLPGGTGPHATPRIQLGNNVRYFPSTLPDVRTHDLHLLDLGLYKTFSLPRDMEPADPHRGHQRAQLHGAVEPQPGPAQHRLRDHQPGPQQPAGHPARSAADLLRTA